MRISVLCLLLLFFQVVCFAQSSLDRIYTFHFTLEDKQVPFHSVMAMYAYDSELVNGELTFKQNHGPSYSISLFDYENYSWHQIEVLYGVIRITFSSNTELPTLKLRIKREDAICAIYMNIEIKYIENEDLAEIIFDRGNTIIDLSYGLDMNRYALQAPVGQLHSFVGRNLSCFIMKTCTPQFIEKTITRTIVNP